MMLIKHSAKDCVEANDASVQRLVELVFHVLRLMIARWSPFHVSVRFTL